MTVERPTEEAIRDHLRGLIEDELGDALPAAERPLATDRPLADYGLESRSVIALTGEVEDWLEIELDPTMFFDHPSIDALAAFLAAETAPE